MLLCTLLARPSDPDPAAFKRLNVVLGNINRATYGDAQEQSKSSPRAPRRH